MCQEILLSFKAIFYLVNINMIINVQSILIIFIYLSINNLKMIFLIILTIVLRNYIYLIDYASIISLNTQSFTTKLCAVAIYG